MTTNIQRALDKQAAMQEAGDLDCRLEFIAHLILQAKLARAVIEAADGMRRFGSDYRNGTHANILWNALAAWADHVNGEGDK